jgi:sarcosine oxidase
MWTIPGFKIGLYHHFQERGAADELSRVPTERDEAALREGVAKFLPEANGDILGLRTCMFTNTPDENFILDALPDFPEVIVASPCSGHGFKFSTAIGDILADMAMGRPERFDLSPFKLSRFEHFPSP